MRAPTLFRRSLRYVVAVVLLVGIGFFLSPTISAHAHGVTGLYDAGCPFEALAAFTGQGLLPKAPSAPPLALVGVAGAARPVDSPVAAPASAVRLRAPPTR
jgi:hypothetical protein